MLLNIFMALSNWTIIFPLVSMWKKEDYITLFVFCFVGLFSFLSHLVENHKHGMVGIGFTTRTSYILNRLDVLGVTLVVLRLSQIYYNNYGVSLGYVLEHTSKMMLLLLLSLCNLISEHDKYNPDKRTRYIILHALWHQGIFLLANSCYNDLI